MGVLQALLNDALEAKVIPINPIVGLKPLPEDLKEFRYWSKSEITQFLNANRRDSYLPLWITALNTGMRRGELCGLKWDRVDFSIRRITITRNLGRFGLKDNTKSKKKRVIPMNKEVVKIMASLIREQISEFVFHEKQGEPINVAHLDRKFKAAQKRAGFPNTIRFHDLRHTFASHFMMNGGNIYDLQKILGHSSLEMTQRYAHISPEHLDDAINIVSFGVDIDGNSSNKVPNLCKASATL
ncbi:MAG: site-specific integrase, partial [Oligoflexia bacterium]|nr:site-specific integrase [Oligoflexia bacterium]